MKYRLEVLSFINNEYSEPGRILPACLFMAQIILVLIGYFIKLSP